jgi:hypothetical protein
MSELSGAVGERLSPVAGHCVERPRLPDPFGNFGPSCSFCRERGEAARLCDRHAALTTGRTELPNWRFEPANFGDIDWTVSSHRAPATVHAAIEDEARDLLASRFLKAKNVESDARHGPMHPWCQAKLAPLRRLRESRYPDASRAAFSRRRNNGQTPPARGTARAPLRWESKDTNLRGRRYMACRIRSALPIATMLLIGAAAPALADSPCSASYEVHRSDTLCAIVRQSCVAMPQVMTLSSSFEDPPDIAVGTELRLKPGTARGPPRLQGAGASSDSAREWP